MRTYEFIVVLQGSGENSDDAWLDAVEAFSNDPGEPHYIKELMEEEDV